MTFIKSGILMAIWTLLSRITGFLRDSIMANYLGAGMFTDALVAASKLPNSFRRLLGEGAMSSVFVPIFSKDLAEGKKDEAVKFSRQIFTILLIFLIFLVGIFELFMPFFIDLISPGFIDNKEKFDLTVSLARINFVFLITISLISLCGGILNSLHKFSHFAAMPILLNCGVIGSIFLCAYRGGNEESITYFISYATVAVGIFQLSFFLKICKKNGVAIKLQKPSITKEVKTFFKKMIHGLIGSGIYQVNIFVDTIFASMFSGGVSYLYYTDRINQLPLTLIGGTFGVTLLPILSKFIKLGDAKSFASMQKESVKFCIFASSLSVITINAMGYEIVDFIYHRGEFSANDAKVVYIMLSIFSVGFVFSVLSKVYNTFLFANGDTKTPMYIGIICTATNIVVNLFTYRHFGFYCVVYATLTSSILSGVLPAIKLYKNKQLFFDAKILSNLVKIVIVSGIVYILQQHFYKYCISLDVQKRIALFFTLITSSIVYIALCIVTKVYSYKEILGIIKRRKL